MDRYILFDVGATSFIVGSFSMHDARCCVAIASASQRVQHHFSCISKERRALKIGVVYIQCRCVRDARTCLRTSVIIRISVTVLAMYEFMFETSGQS